MTEFPPILIDVILIAVFLEFVFLSAILQKSKAGFLIKPLFMFLASGAFLLTAFRLALSEARFMWISAALLGALIAHGVFLWLGWRRFLSNRD